MPVHFYFSGADDSAELTPVQQVFLSLGEMGIGIPVLNRKTLDEFVRRADLIQAYVGDVWVNGDGTPRVFGRADFTELLPVARTNWSARSKREFDGLIKIEQARYWDSVDRKN